MAKSTGNLKEDISKAISRNASGETNIDGYSSELSDAIIEFITRQEFRVVKLESKMKVDHIKTTRGHPVDVSPNTLFGPYSPLISMLKKIPGMSTIFEPLESKLKSAILKVSSGGASLPKLNISDGGPWGDLDVKGISEVDTSYKGKTSSDGISTKSAVVLFKDEIID